MMTMLSDEKIKDAETISKLINIRGKLVSDIKAMEKDHSHHQIALIYSESNNIIFNQKPVKDAAINAILSALRIELANIDMQIKNILHGNK